MLKQFDTMLLNSIVFYSLSSFIISA